jgi:hypothetical protein
MGIRLVAPTDSGADILEGCRNRDPEAQRRVFERYKGRVFSVALGFLKGNHAAAEDVTQEVLVKVFRAAKTFRQDARLSTWLHRITVNACMDELRRRKRVLLFGDVPPGLEGQVGPHEPNELGVSRGGDMKRLVGVLALSGLLIAATPESYGGWATVTLLEVPEYLEVGTPTTLSFTIRQHGKTVMWDREPSLILPADGWFDRLIKGNRV